MAINKNDPKFDRLRSLDANGVVAERARLSKLGQDIFTRAQGGFLDDEADRELRSVEDDLEFLRDREASEARLRSLVDAGSTMPGDERDMQRAKAFNVGGAHTNEREEKPMRGNKILTRDNSCESWARDNGLIREQDSDLSFDKFVRGVYTGNWDGATHERALAEGTGSAGGYTVPAPIAASVIDKARNASVVMQAGALTVPMTSNTLALPRLVSEGTPAWKLENTEILAEDMTFDSVTLTARKLTRLIRVSNELLADSPIIDGTIANVFAAQMAAEVDRVAILGTGTAPEPRGLVNTVGVPKIQHGANGGAPTNYDWPIDAVIAVAAAGYTPSAILMAPRTLGSFAKLREGAGTGNYLTAPEGLPPVLVSSMIPINLTKGSAVNASLLVTGQFGMLAIGIRQEFTLSVLDQRYAEFDQTAFKATLRMDVAVLQPTAFVVDEGIIP